MIPKVQDPAPGSSFSVCPLVHLDTNSFCYMPLPLTTALFLVSSLHGGLKVSARIYLFLKIVVSGVMVTNSKLTDLDRSDWCRKTVEDGGVSWGF